MNNQKLIGPISQVLTLDELPLKGALHDGQLEIIQHAGILIEGDKILQVKGWENLRKEFPTAEIFELTADFVALPGLIDCHTHSCFGGSRAKDFILRNAGKSYLEIAEAGGGIWDTVTETRKLNLDELAKITTINANRHLSEGVTTIEVKSGYGLSLEEELKMLRAIQLANTSTFADLIPTCLAAHVKPSDFNGSNSEYLDLISNELFPLLTKEKLSNRIDAFVEKSAFSLGEIKPYFQKAKDSAFDLTVHADQFSPGGSKLAVAFEARSADHLEASGAEEISLLAQSDTIAVALPGASIGLGVGFTPARKILDQGGALAIASDWNPGSAPMGDLLALASILASFEKLSAAEVFAAVTFRAAAALGLADRGKLAPGLLADFILFPTSDYREILYHQGKMKPEIVWKSGRKEIWKPRNQEVWPRTYMNKKSESDEIKADDQFSPVFRNPILVEIEASKTINPVSFQDQIKQGIPTFLPPKKKRNPAISHAPKRKDVLAPEEKKLALKNALRYFPKNWHQELAFEFLRELEEFGRIYMYRFMPDYPMYARPITEYPAQSRQAAAIMLMIQNNLDPAVAQHPEELITYGGNGAVFQNWAQYLLTMHYLSEMTEEQTLHMYSGHPMGLFPSSPEAPRVIVTNGMMIPNYSKPDDWERFNALGVTQYGQMTAGSYMYIGPQGIVHGTTITVMNAFRKKLKVGENPKGKIFLTAGLGGMSGAQPKAGNIAGCVTVCAEVNPAAARKRHDQGWVDELIEDLDELVERVKKAKINEEVRSIAFLGNVVDVWERFDEENIFVELGSDQTSLHNPWAGGYYPAGLSFGESNRLMAENPNEFKTKVQESLCRQAAAIHRHAAKGTYFFDYGNAFLLEASRAGAEVMAENGIDFRYSSYVQDILGPMCFDFGFGPFRWVCTSGKTEDLRRTDQIAASVLKDMLKSAPLSISQQLQDNITWIEQAEQNNLVVGSQARILYADAEGRAKIAEAFNTGIAKGEISAPIVLGRDHHDVSGTDSPYRETSNIYDGSRFTADMAIHNVIGDSFRGATWVSIHNGGGVGWGEVINGGFGLVLDGSKDAERRLKSMLFYDVNNGIARRAWARNPGSMEAIKREMNRTPGLKVSVPNLVDEEVLGIV